MTYDPYRTPGFMFAIIWLYNGAMSLLLSITDIVLYVFTTRIYAEKVSSRLYDKLMWHCKYT